MRFLGLLLFAAALPLSALEIGDEAPSLEPVIWLKGEAPAYADQVTIVEFWATWCGPCKQTIPHLTELAAKHGDKLAVVGISREERAKAEPFVEEQGDAMAYNVGLLGRDEYGEWMRGVRGIPHAFIVSKEGKVLWKGHPLSMDQSLDEVLAGTFDLERAVAMQKAKTALEATFQSNDLDTILAAAEKVLELDGTDGQSLHVVKEVAKRKQEPGMYREKVEAIDVETLSAATANRLAMDLLRNDTKAYRLTDLLVAFSARAEAQAPDDHPESKAAILATAAEVRYRLCDLPGAIAKQQAALDLIPDDAALAADLAYYQQIQDLTE